MTGVSFGINFLTEDLDESLRVTKLAEKSGFSNIWYVDSHILWRDPYPYLTATALNTKKMNVGLCVSNTVTRHPTVTASAICTVNEISNGRAILGIGRGDSAVRAMGDKPEKLDTFKQRVKMIKALCNQQEIDYKKNKVKFRWIHRNVPTYVAAYGPKVLKFAGQVGDGVILQIGDPDIIKSLLDYVRQGAKEARRDFKKIQVVAATACYVSEDLIKCREEVKWLPAAVGNHVLDLLGRYPSNALPKELVQDIQLRKEGYDYAEHCRKGAQHTSYVTDRLVDRFTIIGTPEDCIKRISQLRDVGVTHVCLYLFGEGKEQITNAFGEEVIPNFN